MIHPCIKLQLGNTKLVLVVSLLRSIEAAREQEAAAITIQAQVRRRKATCQVNALREQRFKETADEDIGKAIVFLHTRVYIGIHVHTQACA